MTDKYAVIGNPIGHSKSPDIHRMFANQTNQDMAYTALQAEPDQFDSAIDEFISSNGMGLNITLPFKQEAFRLANQLSVHAQRSGAVNTLIISSTGEIHGDNTDGVGLLRDLTKNLNIKVNEARILVLGAGGAVRGILPSLIDEKPVSITLANRTESKAHDIANLFLEVFPISPNRYDQLAGKTFDLIINGTSSSVTHSMPEIPNRILELNGFVYDLMYASEPTPFLKWGISQGASLATDGLGMLVEQAAQSFYLWRSILPETEIVIKTLKQQFQTHRH